MKILTESKKLNVAIICGIAICAFLIIQGIIYASLGTLMPYHRAYTGLTEESIRNFNPELMYLISVLIRLYGFIGISWGIALIFILFAGFRKCQKWAWFSFLISGIIYITPVFIFTYPIIGNIILYKICIFLCILWIIQLFLPYKEFFK